MVSFLWFFVLDVDEEDEDEDEEDGCAKRTVFVVASIFLYYTT
jgi:hypothetical protein